MDYLDKTLVRQLAEIGIMAAYYGYHRECEAICAGLWTCKPDSVVPDIIRALSAINQGDTQAAVELLNIGGENRSVEEPLLKALSGMAFGLAGLSKRCEQMLAEVLHCPEAGEHSDAGRLASAILSRPLTNPTMGVRP